MLYIDWKSDKTMTNSELACIETGVLFHLLFCFFPIDKTKYILTRLKYWTQVASCLLSKHARADGQFYTWNRGSCVCVLRNVRLGHPVKLNSIYIYIYMYIYCINLYTYIYIYICTNIFTTKYIYCNSAIMHIYILSIIHNKFYL